MYLLKINRTVYVVFFYTCKCILPHKIRLQDNIAIHDYANRLNKQNAALLSLFNRYIYFSEISFKQIRTISPNAAFKQKI